LDLPAQTLVMDCTLPVAEFTPREKDLTRLGLLFNLAQRDIADDLFISTDFVAEVMSQVYEKLGLRKILSGEQALEDYFQDEKLQGRCRNPGTICRRRKPARTESARDGNPGLPSADRSRNHRIRLVAGCPNHFLG